MHAIYFVGAGLSRALQQTGYPIPLMTDFVHVASRYAESDTASNIILLELIGLEQLNRFRWPCPEAKALADAIDIDNKDPATVAAFLAALRRRAGESIEDLLIREVGPQPLGSALVSNPPVRFRYAINRLFVLIGWQADLQLVQTFVASRLAAAQKHTFVSFNYDLFLDRAIQLTCSTWHPHCGYGVEMRYTIAVDPSEYGEEADLVPKHGCDGAVVVLKPHGSLNWLVPVDNSGSAIPFGEGPVVVRVDASGHVAYVQSPPDWPRVKYKDTQKRAEVAPGVIPPAPRKDARNAVYAQSLETEFTAIQDADEAFVLGWSLPTTDEDQRCLIHYAAQLRRSPLKRVVVVNRNQPPEYFDRVATTFGVERTSLQIWNDGFGDYVAANAG